MGNLKPEFIHERQEMLTLFVKSFLKAPHLWNSSIFLHILQINNFKEEF